MKKGDLRKQKILTTAEELFFTKGYEQTTVQDILDALHLSKGGFYHYFSAKEAVLLEVCAAHIEERVAGLQEMLHGRASFTERMNLLLKQVNFAENERSELAAILIRVCYIGGDVRVLTQLRTGIANQLMPLLRDLLAEGNASGEIFVRDPQRMATILLHMAECADDDCCRLLTKDCSDYDAVLEAMDVLNAAREAMESLLCASYGSLCLMDMAAMVEACRKIQIELSGKEETTP